MYCNNSGLNWIDIFQCEWKMFRNMFTKTAAQRTSLFLWLCTQFPYSARASGRGGAGRARQGQATSDTAAACVRLGPACRNPPHSAPRPPSSPHLPQPRAAAAACASVRRRGGPGRPAAPARAQQLYHSSSESCQSANKRQRRLLFPWPQVSNTGWIKAYRIVSDGERGWSSGKSSQWCFFFIVILRCWVVVAARWGTGDGRLAGPRVTWSDTVNISQRSWSRNETFTLLSRPRRALGEEGNLRWIMTVYGFNDCHEWMPSFVVEDKIVLQNWPTFRNCKKGHRLNLFGSWRNSGTVRLVSTHGQAVLSGVWTVHLTWYSSVLQFTALWICRNCWMNIR